MRSIGVVLLGCVASVFMLATVGSLYPDGALSAESAEAAPAVAVRVECKSNPEVARVKNNTRRAITVRTVGSIHESRGNEPFRVGRVLKPGRAIAFQSGYDARRMVLTRQYIYDNDVGRNEGVRVRTSIGTFAGRC